jgi:hypothetical protein
MLRVQEFRLMANDQYCFAEDDILMALTMFPKLKKLGLAHMLLVEGRWESLMVRVGPWDLERLGLMDPRHVSLNVASGKYSMDKYEVVRRWRARQERSVWLIRDHYGLQLKNLL